MYDTIFKNIIKVVDAQKYGTTCCIPVIESSQYLKAKIQSLDECYKAIEESGPNAVGKRGIQIIARLLDDSSSECKSATLKVLTLLKEKFNNDERRLLKACGSSLSSKGKTMLSNHWKGQTNKVTIHPDSTEKTVKAKPRRESFLSTPGSLTKSRSRPQIEFTQKSNANEPSPLNLRLGDIRKSALNDTMDVKSNSPNPFKFHDPSFEKEDLETQTKLELKSPTSSIVQNKESETIQSDAAASLRSRLQQIRERHRTNVSDIKLRPSTADSISAGSSVHLSSNTVPLKTESSIDYSMISSSIKVCMKSSTPLSEENSVIRRCVDSLRQLHVAISSPATSPQLKLVRKEFETKINEGVSDLTRYVPINLFKFLYLSLVNLVSLRIDF